MMNEYRFKTDIPKEEYEQFVQSHQLCNLLQSYDWAKVKNNWDHVYAGVYDKNKLAATGLILNELPRGKPRGIKCAQLVK